MGKLGMRNNKMLVFMCINLTNLCCHSVYSVLAAFFPQEAEKKGLSEDAVGVHHGHRARLALDHPLRRSDDDAGWLALR